MRNWGNSWITVLAVYTAEIKNVEDNLTVDVIIVKTKKNSFLIKS